MRVLTLNELISVSGGETTTTVVVNVTPQPGQTVGVQNGNVITCPPGTVVTQTTTGGDAGLSGSSKIVSGTAKIGASTATQSCAPSPSAPPASSPRGSNPPASAASSAQ